ncbi:MAG TPA: hypothetical protein VGK67_17425 [Myxococcales bacterium]
MSEPLANPTLVLGLGAFGREVCALLVRDTADPSTGLGTGLPPPNLVILRANLGANEEGQPRSLDAKDEAGLGKLLGEIHDAARSLLDLKQRVETTLAGDARPPRLDILMLADLGEAGAAPLVPLLCERVGVQLREAFRPIFAGTGGRLTVCPVLALPRAVRGRAEMREAVDALDALARAKDERRRPLAPVYLVEDQCARYVLSPGEVVRTVASWLHLVLYSGLRHHEDALKSLVEQDGESVAPFATFACATLEFDTRPLERYCAGRIALEIAEAMLEEQDAVSDAESAAKRLSPEAVLAQALSRGTYDKPIAEELKLDRAALALRDPEWRESPEDVSALLGPFVARALDSADKQRADIEGFRMEAAARLVDAGGLDVLTKAEKAVEDEVARCLKESPAGAERARLRLEALQSRLERLDETSQRAINKPDLPKLPETKRLLEAERAANQALDRRPRLGRLVGWGVAAAGLLAVFLAGVTRFAWRATATERIPLDAADVTPEGWTAYVVGWPYVGIWAGILAAAWVAFTLVRHYRAEHQALLGRFEELRRSAREHFGDLERYFAKRVAYSQDLWGSRVASHLRARVEGEKALLEASRASLQKSRDRLAEEVRAQAGEGPAATSGILFRGLLSGADMAAIYEAKAKPQSAAALAQRFVDETAAGPERWRGGDYAERQTLLAFAQRLCPDLTRLRPFAEGPTSWAGGARGRASEFLRQLASKLTVPLELGVDNEGRTTTYVAYVPKDSRAEVEAVLRGEDLTRRWTVREAGDERRMHLFIATRDVARRSLKLLEPDGEGH